MLLSYHIMLYQGCIDPFGSSICPWLYTQSILCIANEWSVQIFVYMKQMIPIRLMSFDNTYC